MSENIIELKPKSQSLSQLNQELDAYLYQLTILFYKTNELKEKVQELIKIQK